LETIVPKLDLDSIPKRTGTNYPPEFAEHMKNRIRQRLGDAGGLTQFGVNLLQLAPGSWSAQRHWHTHEDEFVYIVSGELVLVTDEGEQVMRAGDCAAFPAGVQNGHHLVNRSGELAVALEVGSRVDADCADYPDIDMRWDGPGDAYRHKDGTPYE
jgi:uncharacterized cupin superfamily protein